MLIDRLEAAYNSIIFDYGNDMGHMEYEANYNGYELTLVVDNGPMIAPTGRIIIYGTDCIYEFAICYGMDIFTDETLDQFKLRILYALVYDLHEVEYLM